MTISKFAEITSVNQDHVVLFMGNDGSFGEYRQTADLAAETVDNLKSQGLVRTVDFSFFPAAASGFIEQIRGVRAETGLYDAANPRFRAVIGELINNKEERDKE